MYLNFKLVRAEEHQGKESTECRAEPASRSPAAKRRSRGGHFCTPPQAKAKGLSCCRAYLLQLSGAPGLPSGHDPAADRRCPLAGGAGGHSTAAERRRSEMRLHDGQLQLEEPLLLLLAPPQGRREEAAGTRVRRSCAALLLMLLQHPDADLRAAR